MSARITFVPFPKEAFFHKPRTAPARRAQLLQLHSPQFTLSIKSLNILQ